MQQELEKFGNRGLDVFGYLDESKHNREVQSYKYEDTLYSFAASI